LFHDKRHPADLGAAEVVAFLSYLATHRNVSRSTQNEALSAILFLYRDFMWVTLPYLITLSIRVAKVSAAIRERGTQFFLAEVSC
jgi:hypothetical protein